MFGLFPKDPEVVKILDRLVERLKNIDEWKTDSSNDIRHREFNIELNKDRISGPKHTMIRWRYIYQRKCIKKAINQIYRCDEVNKLNFIFDVIDGKYPYQTHVGGLNDERQSWLDENSKEGEYVYDRYWLYFADEPLAMAFKLAFKSAFS